MGFRPRIVGLNNAVHCLRIGLGVTIISFVPSSVPMLGIIFYQTDTKTIKRLEAAITFPSPYWGLFFYRQLEQEIYNLYVLVSVPYWGLFFISTLYSYDN